MSDLNAAYAECARITRSRGANFSVGFEELPEPKRTAVQASYAFCRLADDLADEPLLRADPRRLLDEWRAELAAVYRGRARHPVGIALTDTVHRYPIARRCFDDLIRGCEQDLHFRTPEHLAALRRYCDLVATPIGEISLSIFGGARARLRPLARHLAHALQWTNILRDVREDAERGRVYLPADWRAEEGVDDDVLRARARPGLLRVIERGVAVARDHYDAARELADGVDPDARSTVRLMTGVYREILERIAAEPGRVLEERVALSDDEKHALVQRERQASASV